MNDYTQTNKLYGMTIKQEFEDLRKLVDRLRERAEKETNLRMTEFIKEVGSANKAWAPFVAAVDNLKRTEQIISTLKYLNLYESEMTPLRKRTKTRKTKTRKTKTLRRNKPLRVSRENRTYQSKIWSRNRSIS